MAVPTDPIEPTRETIEEAAAWQAQMADEECSDDDRAAFRLWIAADPSRRLAYDRMSLLAGDVESIAEASPERGGIKPHPVGRNALPGVLLLGLLCGFAWWGVDQPDIRARLAEERTPIGEQEQVLLGAGDRITLDSESAVDLDDQAREVRLWRGAVMADVNPARQLPSL